MDLISTLDSLMYIKSSRKIEICYCDLVVLKPGYEYYVPVRCGRSFRWRISRTRVVSNKVMFHSGRPNCDTSQLSKGWFLSFLFPFLFVIIVVILGGYSGWIHSRSCLTQWLMHKKHQETWSTSLHMSLSSKRPRPSEGRINSLIERACTSVSN